MTNIHPETIRGFGREWSAYDQNELRGAEYERVFDEYFEILDFDQLPSEAEGFDFGCGSGRWAASVAPRIGKLHCIDASREVLDVAQRRLSNIANVSFHLASSDCIPLPDSSQDFGYSLGVLHHIPNTALALRDCVQKLKIGAPFLLYIYYRLENRPAWYRGLWRLVDILRRGVSRLPFEIRKAVTVTIATLVYWPLARAALVVERSGRNVRNMPLSAYRNKSFYTMRTDALDRFGTRLEQRFSRAEIERMMKDAGLESIRFRDAVPYWIACGVRRQ